MKAETIEQYLPALTNEQIKKLCVIGDCVENAKLNVTALKTEKEIVLLHFFDSLALMNTGIFKGKKSIIDIGTGGGFPALPLALCLPECSILANDSTEKKLRFVEETAQTAGVLNINTLVGRAEELSRDKRYREKFDISVSRAVARLKVLAELSLPFVKVGGVFAAMKGSDSQAELAEAMDMIRKLGGSVERVFDYKIPEYDYDHSVILIRKTAKTHDTYPRRYGKIIA